MRYINRERIGWVILLFIFVIALSGCSGYDVALINFQYETNPFGQLLIWPIAFVMYHIGMFFNGSFAWGLIFTTIIVRTIAWPIYARTNDMSLKMNLAQPEMQKIQEKYRGRADQEAKAKQSQELMAVYKKYNINIFGCFMPLLQMPLFMGMYAVVRRIRIQNISKTSMSLTNNKLFIFDLGSNATSFNSDIASACFGIFLSAVVGVTMFLIQHISAKKPAYAKKLPAKSSTPQADAMQKQMKFINYFMIISMIAVACTDNGMALYWVIGNLYSLSQIILNRHLNEKKFVKMSKDKLV